MNTTALRPFFGFYGGKWRDTPKHYPPPRFDTIVEPFAGSAGYSVRHHDRRVVLYELDPIIAGLWNYLIHVSPEELRSIPDVHHDQTVDDLKICEEARWLVGFWLNRGVSQPRPGPSRWMRDGIRPGSFWGERVRETIAGQVDLIRHWSVHNTSYENCPSEDVTWFVDPPYQGAGWRYRFGSDRIDYEKLGLWCRSRAGQVIACENAGATWLPFEHLSAVRTTRVGFQSQEVMWTSGGEPLNETSPLRNRRRLPGPPPARGGRLRTVPGGAHRGVVGMGATQPGEVPPDHQGPEQTTKGRT